VAGLTPDGNYVLGNSGATVKYFENVDASGYTGTTGLTLITHPAIGTTILKGGSGDDAIWNFAAIGGVIDGGPGTDTLVFGRTPAGVVDLSQVDQTPGEPTRVTGFENVDASNLTSASGEAIGLRITGTTGTTLLKGGPGQDTITYFNTPGGILEGGAEITPVPRLSGGDTLVFNQGGTVDLSSSANQVIGSNTVVTGFEYVDASGSTSPVTLIGSDRANILKGGSASDVIQGGRGDTLTGNAGSDRFVLKESGGTITDFQSGASGDQLDFTTFAFTTTNGVTSSNWDPSTDAVIKLAGFTGQMNTHDIIL
jgi:hypothetical protein